LVTTRTIAHSFDGGLGANITEHKDLIAQGSIGIQAVSCNTRMIFVPLAYAHFQ
jgi:hypothetical protein